MPKYKDVYMVVFNVGYSNLDVARHLSKLMQRESGCVFDILKLRDYEFDQLRDYIVTDEDLIESKPWWDRLEC